MEQVTLVMAGSKVYENKFLLHQSFTFFLPATNILSLYQPPSPKDGTSTFGDGWLKSF
jgi:hypothetical protein